MKLTVVDWLETEPIKNLAIEAYLTESVQEDEVIVYLWQNANTVVIGRHQNVWQECDMKRLREDNVSLVRRLSGGGAVYHDLGNLNFTFITTDAHYDVQRQLSVIIEAVRSLGINAEFSGRNDLLAEGRKFSGNAFYRTKNKRYHHGTLLVDVNKEKMSHYLQVKPSKFQGKGVKSVKSRVINLKELNSDVTISKLKDALKSASKKIYGCEARGIEKDRFDEDIIARKIDRFSDTTWIMGKDYKGVYQEEHRFDWGHVSFHWEFDQTHNYIAECVIYSDAMDEQWIYDVAEQLKGLLLNKGNIYQCISAIPLNQKARTQKETKELATWLEETIWTWK